VIEFGAGAALPGILCVKRGAQFVTLTDYPDPAIVQNLERNWFENLVESVQDKDARRIAGFPSFDTEAYKEIVTSAPFAKGSRRDQEEQRVKCAVRGHAWGENVQEMLECLPSSTQDSEQATGARGVVSDMKNSDRRYDWVLLADTLWVSEGHADLLKSCLAVLRGQGKIFVCCGLHTGYNTVQRFMTLATSPVFGLHSRLVEIRRMPLWGETRSPEELRKENELLKEEDLEQFSVEDRNRTVLVYELWR
jgi:nicotinamide N-methyltransferase